MMGEIRIALGELNPPETAILQRYDEKGRITKVVTAGPLTEVALRYRPGDLLIVSEDIWHDLNAHFAKDVTPRPSLQPKDTPDV